MADYKRMYSKLFNAVTDAIKLLQTAQQDTEDIYISGEEVIINLVGQNDEQETGGDQT